MNVLLTLLLMVMPLAALAQSSPPPCPPTDVKHLCFGELTGKDASGDEWKYLGEFKDDKRHGLGTVSIDDGKKYVGQFKDGKYDGLGAGTFPNGNKYIGEFKDGKPSGQGTFTWPNGRKYIGEFKGGRPTGQGTFTWPDGKKYVGEFKEGSPNGKGTYTFGDGKKFVGEFKNGYLTGEGSLTLVDGRKFVGEFKNFKPDGQGIEYLSNGAVQRSGNFVDGKLIQKYEIDVRRFPFDTGFDAQKVASDIENRSITGAELAIKRQQEQEKRFAQIKSEIEHFAAQMSVQNTQQSNSQPSQFKRSDRRLALVIGNGAYKVRPLNNPVNDANDVSNALKRSGFQVIDVRNANLTQMRAKIREFGDQLINSDVGLVYYSGHGVELKGRNYLIPVNADIQREDEIADQGLDAGLILEKMSTAGKGVNILVVDACRDDPFGRSFRSTGRGLAQMDAPKGTIIAYSTSPGKVASDGDPKGRNSPYTKHLLRAMQIPNIPIEQVFKEVRRSVQAETQNQQTPWENTSLSGDFYFSVKK